MSKRFEFVELPGWTRPAAGPAPYLDYDPLPEEAEPLIDERSRSLAWRGAEDLRSAWAIEHSARARRGRPRTHPGGSPARPREVVPRLSAEINYWDTRHADCSTRSGRGGP